MILSTYVPGELPVGGLIKVVLASFEAEANFIFGCRKVHIIIFVHIIFYQQGDAQNISLYLNNKVYLFLIF